VTAIKFNSREEFIEALEARREFWREQDRLAFEKHRAMEKAHWEKIKVSLVEAAKWDFDEAKEHGFRPSILDRDRYWPSAEACPKSHEAQLDRMINGLRQTHQKRFTVQSSDAWRSEYFILTYDPALDKTVCP
jgi:hypothetical protein